MSKYRITIVCQPESNLPIEKVVECDGYSLIGFTEQVGDQCNMDIDMKDIRDADIRAAIRAADPLRRNAIAAVMDVLGRTVDALLAPDEENVTGCCVPVDEEGEEDAAE